MANKMINILQEHIEELTDAVPALTDAENKTWHDFVQTFDSLSHTVTQQERILETAAAISDAASSILNVDELLGVSANLIKDSFEFQWVNIFLLDRSKQWIELKASTRPIKRDHRQKVASDSSVARSVDKHQPHVVNLHTDQANGQPAAASEAVIPLASRGQVIGALTIASEKQNYFTTNTVRLLQTLADQLANNIQNAVLFTSADNRLEQLVTLHSINLEIGNSTDLNELLDNVAQLSAKLVSADSAIIRLLDEQAEKFRVEAAYQPPEGVEPGRVEMVGNGLSSRVYKSQQAILVNDWPNHPLAANYLFSAELQGPAAILNVPITLQNKIVGTIEVHHQVDLFDNNDLYTLSLLAAHVAVAIENTRLLNRAENNRRFLKTVIEHIPDPIFIKDRSHTWLEMNAANAAVIGQSEEELIGETDETFFPPELAEEFYRRDNEVFETNQIFEYEDKTEWGDGRKHIAYTRLIPIPDSSGQPEYLLGITHDITQQKAHEAERERFLAETAALYRGSQDISSSLSERQIFNALVEQIKLQTPDEIAAYGFQNVKNEPIWADMRAVWQKNDTPTYPLYTKIYLPNSPLAKLLTTGTAIFIEDIAGDSRLSEAQRQAFKPTAAQSAAILPLDFFGEKIGVVLVYFTQRHPFSKVTQRFWLAMADHAGMALSNRQLIREAAYRAIQMETAAEVARAASSVLDLNELLNSAVALIRDRFDLYYAGAFLVDPTREWAVLRAGTGEAGRDQLAKRHRLKIGGDSMIGWSIAKRKPRIALDVGEDAVHFQNPVLPDTRSEMALPLIYHNRAIGALTIQSAEQAAFSREDIIFLQTMADQLANAIQNARLFEQAQQELAERKRIEAELRASELKYRELVENANSIIFRMDTQGHFTFFNEFAQSFFGYGQEEILGENVLDTIVPNTDSQGQDLTHIIKGVLKDPENYANYESENIRRDGTRVWVSWSNKAVKNSSGYITEILCIGNDVTERKEVEEALVRWTAELEETTTFLDSIVDNLPSGIFIKDAEDLKYVRVNKTYERWTGLSRADIIGKTVDDVYPEAHAQTINQQDRRVFETGALLDIPEETIHHQQDEEVRITHTRKLPILNPDKEIKYLLAISEDITERKQAEQEILRRNEELATFNRVARVITAETEPRDRFHNITREMVHIFNARRGGIALLDEISAELTVVADYSTHDDPSLVDQEIVLANASSLQEVVETGQTVVVPNASTNPSIKPLHDVFTRMGITCTMIVPLITGGNVIGTLSIDLDEPKRTFIPDEVQLAETIAGQIAGALENARLLEQTQAALAERKAAQAALAQRERYLAALLETQNLLLAAKEQEAPYSDIVNVLGQVSGASRVYVFENRRDDTGLILTSQKAEWCAPGIEPEINNPELQNLALESLMPRWTNTLAKGSLIAGWVADFPESEREILKPRDIKVILVLPLTVDDAFFGFIGFDNCKDDSLWDTTEEDLLSTAAAAVSLWHERKMAQETMLQALQRTESLYRIGNALATATDQTATFKTVLAEYLRLLDLSRPYGSVILFEHQKGYSKVETLLVEGRHLKSGLTIPVKQDLIAHHLMEHKEPLIIDDVYSHDLTKESPEFWQPDKNVQALLCIPLVVRGKAEGMVAIGSANRGHDFSLAQVELGQVITDQLAIWLENRRLLAETQYRSERLQTAAEVGRAASSILDVHELMNTSVNLIRNQFDFYYVGLFMVDNAKEWAVLRSGTGRAGRIQLARNHRLKIGGGSMIGWSIANREARIALDVGQEAVHFQNPILPDTHSEMALPLTSRDEVLGALTVQSVERSAFSDEDVTLLQTMADQLANALANARLFESVAKAQKEAENRLKDTEALQQLGLNLATTLQVDEILDIFFQACVREIGFEYVQFSLVDRQRHLVRAIGGIGLPENHIKQSVQPLDGGDIMADIVKTGQTEIITGWDPRFDKELFEEEEHSNWVRVFTPVRLRHENIGLVEAGFNVDFRAQVSDNQIKLLKSFVSQTALAIDNAQRYQASQRVARREALIKEITTKVRASTDLDTILQTTVKEVGNAIASRESYILLASPPEVNGKKKVKNGNTSEPTHQQEGSSG